MSETLKEKKESLGSPGEIADPVTPKGGANHKRGADKNAGEKAPITQGSSGMTRAQMVSTVMTKVKALDTDELKGLHQQIAGDHRNGPGEDTILQGNSKLKEEMEEIFNEIFSELFEGEMDEEELAEATRKAIDKYRKGRKDDASLRRSLGRIRTNDRKGARMGKEALRKMAVEDVNTAPITELLSDADLSEEAMQKIGVIFETEVSNRVNEYIDEIADDDETELENIHVSLVEHVDQYLNYVAEAWIEENRIEVENGIRAEIAEGFLQGLHGLFAEHYIEVPDDRVDVVEALVSENKELEESVNKLMTDNVELINKNEEMVRESIVLESLDGLTDVDAEYLVGLTEDLGFEDAESFKKKIQIVKESYFTKVDGSKKGDFGAQYVTEDEDTDISMITEELEQKTHSPEMSRYLDVLRRTSR